MFMSGLAQNDAFSVQFVDSPHHFFVLLLHSERCVVQISSLLLRVQQHLLPEKKTHTEPCSLKSWIPARTQNLTVVLVVFCLFVGLEEDLQYVIIIPQLRWTLWPVGGAVAPQTHLSELNLKLRCCRLLSHCCCRNLSRLSC